MNNSGAIVPDHSVDTTDEEWRQAVDVNLNSAIRFTRTAVPRMREAGGGRIIDNVSVSAHTAMLAFSKSMAVDLAPYDILVN